MAGHTIYRLMAGHTIRSAASQVGTTIFRLLQFENGAVTPTNDEFRHLGGLITPHRQSSLKPPNER